MRTGFSGQVAVITGSSSGIGRAIANALGAQGVRLCLVGRRLDALEAVRSQLPSTCPPAEVYACDLTRDSDVSSLGERLASAHDRIDILVHSAGAISLGSIESAPIADFDLQFQINVRAPYLLTQILLPLVKRAEGQIVFINSSVGICTKQHVGAYAASKHALRAIADTLRTEINAFGVRILSIFPGNTASAMQDAIQEHTGQHLDKQYLLQPEDVASTILHTMLLPRTAEITDIQIRPFRKAPA